MLHRRLSTGGTYLQKRGAGFVFRVRLPTSLARLIGQSELVKSLRTSNPRLARVLAAAIGARLEGLWERIDRMPDAQNEAARLLDVWFRSELDRAWRQFRSDVRSDRQWVPSDVERDAPEQRERWERRALGEQAEHRLDLMQAEFKAGCYSYSYPVARQIVSELDAPFDELDHRFTLLAAESNEGEGRDRRGTS